ncbi:MAG: N-acetylmuramoyl-L-alanine amidase [Oscillospiraceae bacterium]|nr:N-acetylmuramoyl-L-alanine amidase [Oscillospiraceae bacterium]
MSFTIQDANLRFTNNQNRGNTTNTIIIHHVYGRGTVRDIHRWHQGRGWSGIGYHFYVDFDGSIWRGRDMRHVGAHTVGQNNTSVAIVVNGNHHTNDRVSDAMFNALVWLVGHIRSVYGNLLVRGHDEFANTNCPGRHFPMARLCEAISGTTTPPLTVRQQPVLHTVNTSTQPLNVRAAPSSNGNILGTFARGSRVAVTRRDGDWLWATNGRLTGWASAQFLRELNGEESVRHMASLGLIDSPDYWIGQLPNVRHLDTVFNRWGASLLMG